MSNVTVNCPLIPAPSLPGHMTVSGGFGTCLVDLCHCVMSFRLKRLAAHDNVAEFHYVIYVN